MRFILAFLGALLAVLGAGLFGASLSIESLVGLALGGTLMFAGLVTFLLSLLIRA